MSDLSHTPRAIWHSRRDSPPEERQGDGEFDDHPDRTLLRLVDINELNSWKPEEKHLANVRVAILSHIVKELCARTDRGRRALAISMDGDAAALIGQHLEGLEVKPLDLRDGQPGRPAVGQLWNRLQEEREQILELSRSLAIVSMDQPAATVVGCAPASALCWLGWAFGGIPLYSIFNVNRHNGRLKEYRLPERRLISKDGGGNPRYFTARNLPELSPGQSSAPDDRRVLVIDMLGQVKDSDITERFETPTRPMRARLLQMKDLGQGLEPSDYIAVLQEILDDIHHMRESEGVREFHLTIHAQDVIAFGLGRQLDGQGVFHLYEWNDESSAYKTLGTFPGNFQRFEVNEMPQQTADARAPEQEGPNVVRTTRTSGGES